MGRITASAVALLAGVVGPVVAFLVVFAITSYPLPRYFFPELPVAALLVASVIALGLFAPVVVLLSKLRRRTFRTTLAGGAFAGGLPAFLVLWPAPGDITWLRFVGHVAYWASLGAFGAWLFHLALRRFSPNNSSKPTPLRGAA